VTPGKSLVIPVYNAASRQAASAAPAGAAAVASAAPSRNLAKAATATKTPPNAPASMKLAADAAKGKATRAADAARKPEQKVAAVDASKQRAAETIKGAKKDAPKANESVKAKEPAAQKAREVVQKPVAEPERQQTAAAPAATAASDKPEFRWPARGRIIQGFKNGANDGISIAVPEGTSVKAAESGVVAYAGSELKGYGNLVLIRHPNGFVSAYAHNGELSVKRGETVKRGQTIAKSGQSGNVSAPQLHFELRKGSTPVDPTQYLAGL
jgi:murein DD-endopeptidase MepM/ murein hydrolase activator NlpD